MTYRKIIPILLIGTLALAFGIFSYRSVSAQATTPTPETPSQNDEPGRIPRGGLRGGVKDGYLQDDLAAALGIEVDALQAAQQTAAAEALEQAVSQGLITQEQADALTERGLGRFQRGGKGWFGASEIDHDTLLADALGISVEQLRAAYSTALDARLDRAVADGNMTEEQADLVRGQHALTTSQSFQSSMRAAYEAAVQQAVTEGVITQAQADQILENSAGMNFFGDRGHRGRGGFHGRGIDRPNETTPIVPEGENQ